jgi:ATP-dependent Clp protease ATP-binding subunit ClpA
MMFERFTGSARQVVVQAQHHARRYDHNFIGPEHLLLGVIANDHNPVSAVLHDLGLTPERTEAEFARLTGSQPVGAGPKAPTTPQPPAANPLAGLDADALASIGIDLDEVRSRIEATFGPGALSRAALHGQSRYPRRPLHRRLLPRARRGPGHPARRPGRTGPGSPRGHIPFTPKAKKSLELSLREALSLGDNYIGMEHLALALTSMRDGLVPKLLADLHVSPATIRAALLDRHRKAS